MKKIKFLVTLLSMAFIVFGMISIASADTITITPDTEMMFFLGFATNPTDAQLTTASGYAGPWTELYKQEVGGAEVGDFADSYQTFFTPTTDPKGATIIYDGDPDPYINGNPIYLLVKDGKHGHYLFNLSAITIDDSTYSWNGQDTIILSGFYPDGGSISHISIYGTSVPSVPEPATLLLLGFGLVGLAGVGSKFKK
ncbi:MAG: PEP-CTERM sorting domain-containing protein [Pseudomonadota bacterium]